MFRYPDEGGVSELLPKNKIKGKIHEVVRSYIRKIFTNLLTLKLEQKHYLKQSTVCYSIICKGPEDRKIPDIVTPFFKDYLGMDVWEKQIEGYRADCKMTTEVNNPCFLKSTNPHSVWASSLEDKKSISSKSRNRGSSQLLNKNSPDDCRCILQ